MKRFTFLKSLVMLFALCLLGTGAAWAQTEQTVTFDISSYGITQTTQLSNFPLTEGTITISDNTTTGSPRPTFYDDGTLRFYSSNVINISSTGGSIITSISFTIEQGDLSNITASTGNLFSNTWTGESESIDFNKDSGKQVRFSKIEVTYVATAGFVAPPTFSHEEGTYFEPFDLTLSAPDADLVMYTLDGTDPSFEEGVGELYEEGAPIHISETTTVKAIALDAEGNASRVVSATYTILTIEASTYQAVTSSAELVDGGTYIIVAESNGVSVALSEAADNKRTPAPVTIEGNQIVTPVNVSQLPYEITLQHVSGNQYRLYDATSGGFIATSGKNTDLDISNNENEASAWEISISDDETAFVNTAQTSRGILYRISQNVFGAYANSNKNNKDYSTVRLYKKVEAATTGTFSIGAPGYSTYFTDKAFVMPEGVEGGIVTDAADGRLTVDYCYPSGTTVPANTGLLLKGAAKTYTYDLSTETPDAPEVNYLKGSVDAATTEGEGCLFYMLSYDHEGKNLGFYWGKEDGAPFENGAGKAYLALPQAVASQVRGFVLDGTTTGISGVTTEANNAPAAVYSLTGVRMGTTTDGLPAGIYIVNGKKVLVK